MARKRSSTPEDWVPLDPTAFEHIKTVMGGWRLAAEDLRLRLVAGDVEAEDRMAVQGKGITVRRLTKDDLRNVLVNANSTGVWLSGFFPLHGHNIFLRRADVDRCWPQAAQEPGPDTSDQRPQLPEALRKRPHGIGIGAKTWTAILAIYALDRAGRGWVDLKELRGLVNEPRDKQHHVSKRTVDTAVAYLREHKLYSH